jgi:O-6-methylguanine DNA methyltransferase
MEIVHTAETDTPIGRCRVASTGQGLAYVELPHASGRGLGGWLRRCAGSADVVQAFAPNRVAIGQLLEFLEGKRTEFDLALDLRGTPFQRAVWAVLLEIPYGETRSYRQIAQEVGRPNAVRAVGAANAANPVSLVVPCHRVIGADGRLTGYGGGTDVKARLLAMEGSRRVEGRLL